MFEVLDFSIYIYRYNNSQAWSKMSGEARWTSETPGCNTSEKQRIKRSCCRFLMPKKVVVPEIKLPILIIHNFSIESSYFGVPPILGNLHIYICKVYSTYIINYYSNLFNVQSATNMYIWSSILGQIPMISVRLRWTLNRICSESSPGNARMMSPLY